MNIFWRHIFVIYMIHKIHGNPCRASIPTEQIVSSCPQSEREWKKAAERKQCHEIAIIQNCTKPANFEYHCLLKEDITHFVEVCAPVFNINGYCAKYDTRDHRVNHFIDHDCTKDNPPCEPFYKSSEAYKYTSCYDLVQKNKTTTYTMYQNPEKSDNLYIIFVLGGFLTLSIVLNVILVGYYLYRRRNIKRGTVVLLTSKNNIKKREKKKIEEKWTEKGVDVPQDREIKAAENQKYDTERDKKQLCTEKKVTNLKELFQNRSDSDLTADKSGKPKPKKKLDMGNCTKSTVNADVEEAAETLLRENGHFANTEEEENKVLEDFDMQLDDYS